MPLVGVAALMSPELVATVAALFGMLAYLLATHGSQALIVNPLQTILSKIPLIGVYVAAAVTEGVIWVISTSTSWLENSWRDVANLFQTITHDAVGWLSVLTGAIDELTARGITLSALLSANLKDLWGNVSGVLARVSTLASQVASILARLTGIDAAIAYVEHTLIPAAINQAIAAARAAAAAMVAVEAAARIELGKVLAAAIAAAVAAEQTARMLADRNILAELYAALTAAVAKLRQEQDDATKAAAAAIDAAEVEITDIQKVIAQANPVTIAADVAALSVLVETTFRNCVAPTCGVMGSLDSLADSLSSAAQVGILAGLVAAAISNPQGTANAVAGWRGEVKGAVNPVLAILGAPGI